MVKWLMGTAILGQLIGSGAIVGELKVGEKAPAFKLAGSDGKSYDLSDFKEKKVVVLAWFPKAATPG